MTCRSRRSQKPGTEKDQRRSRSFLSLLRNRGPSHHVQVIRKASLQPYPRTPILLRPSVRPITSLLYPALYVRLYFCRLERRSSSSCFCWTLAWRGVGPKKKSDNSICAPLRRLLDSLTPHNKPISYIETSVHRTSLANTPVSSSVRPQGELRPDLSNHALLGLPPPVHPSSPSARTHELFCTAPLS
jgi:hypothetical protein